MAVAHSSASESHTGTTGSANQASFSWTHTQTGTPQGVVVFVHTNGSTNLTSSVTYGTVTLTAVTGGSAVDTAGEPCRTDVFFAGTGLPSGNQTITVNRTNNATVMYSSAATVTAGADTAIPSATIVLLEGDGTLAEQNVNDTSPGQNSVRYAGITSGLNNVPAAGANSTALVSIDYGNNYTAALVRETTAGQGSRPVGFSSGTNDDRAAVHLAVRELVNRNFSQTVGTFTLTGNNATLTKASPKVLTAETGTFTLTGNNADLTHQHKITGETGTFTLTGNNAGLTHQHKLTAETGTFTLTGNNTTFTRAKNLPVTVGTFTLTGNDATLGHNSVLNAETGTFALTGNNATLIKAAADELNAVVGTFNLTGNNATLRHARNLAGDKGTFTLTGNAASLLYKPVLQGQTGVFNLTGNAAIFAKGKKLSVDVGVFNLTGNAITFTENQVLTATKGTFVLTGNNATLTSSGATRRRVVFIF